MTFADNDFLIAIADGCATQEELERYEAFRHNDPRIELYVELLRQTRARLQRTATTYRQEVPPDLLARIRQETLQQSPTLVRLSPRWWMIAAAAAVIVALVFIPWQMKPTDFRKESLENFERIIGGQLTVAKATNSFDDLVAFFHAQGVRYQLVSVPLKAELIGGVVSEHNGTKLAHLVYRRGDTLIYMYQAPEELFKRGILALPSLVSPYAESGRWYAEDVTRGSWMFWRIQSVYCSVVANVPKDVLATYFVEGAI